jgi:S-adenosylmethionine synthetase
MAFEKVNPSHPDKVADRIAGAIVDLAYKEQANPKIAVEVLIGHGYCNIITETSVSFGMGDITEIVDRIAGADGITVRYHETAQDPKLAKNQAEKIKCGDNGIFKGVPINQEEKLLSETVRGFYEKMPTDGKFIYDKEDGIFIACQSNATNEEIADGFTNSPLSHMMINRVITNPLGPWTGGTNVDTGATNRKLGSDMGRAVTGGGLHGKDLSKADVSVNIVCHILAQEYKTTVEALCAIGDETITFKMHRAGRETTTKEMSYEEVVRMAKDYINELGGFEKLAEWGLI